MSNIVAIPLISLQQNVREIKILNEKQIILENTSFKIYDLKRFMRKHRDTLEEIVIKNCATGQKRFECIHILFLETDLLLIDFTNLKKLEVDNLQAQKEENDVKYKQQMDNLYLHSLKSLTSQFNIHLMLRQNLNQDKTKIVIKQLSFDSKNAFYYSLNALLKYKMQLKCVTFVNVLDMKINPMKAFCEKMRDLAELIEIQFINVLFSDQNILHIRYLLNWRQKELERLVFKRIQMSEYQLQLLFIANNFSFLDLTNLKELIFKCDEKLQKSQLYKNLLKQFDSLQKKQQAKQLYNNTNNNQQTENKIQLTLQQQQKQNHDRHYIKQKLFGPKHIIIHNQLKISQFSSFQKDLQQPLKILLFQLSQSNFCQELDISAISLIGAPQEIINYLIKAVCDSLSLHTLKIQNCQELINLLLSEFRSKNNLEDKEDSLRPLKKNLLITKKSLRKKMIEPVKDKPEIEKKLQIQQNDIEIQSGQIQSKDELSNRQQTGEDRVVQIIPKSSNFIKVNHSVKRKALKQFTVEGSIHNIFGQSSLSNIIQMMQYSETVALDFKDSALSKDGIKGILDGFNFLNINEDDFEVRNFILKNVDLSPQIDAQIWMKFGQNLLTAAGEFLESVQFDSIKVKDVVFNEIMRGILSFKVKQMKIQLTKFVISKKSDIQMKIDTFLNDILTHFPLTELRISSQVDSNLFKQTQNHNIVIHNNNNLVKVLSGTNNNINLTSNNNKVVTQTMPSHHIKSHQLSMSQCGQQENAQSLAQIVRYDINIIPSSSIKILQLNQFKQINWAILFKSICQSYIKLEELDVSDNGLSLHFVKSLVYNSGLQNLTLLKKLNLSKNPLKTITHQVRTNYMQNSQASIISGNLIESQSQKFIKSQQFRQNSVIKQKIKLQNSIDLNILSPSKKGSSYQKGLSFQNEVEEVIGSVEDFNSEENHKKCDDSSQISENYPNQLDISKSIIPERKRQVSIVGDEYNLLRGKQKFDEGKIKKSDDNIVKRVMNEFFTFIFSLESLEQLNLSSTQMANSELDIIEQQIQNSQNKAHSLNFETIILNNNIEIRQTELFKKKVSVFQEQIDNQNSNNKKITQDKSNDTEMISLPKSIISRNYQITELNLSKWDINPDFTKKLIQILNLKQYQFQTINLSENINISYNQWYEIILQIFKLQGKYLENLYLCNCKFDDKHILEICKGIQQVCLIKKEEILNKYEYGALQLNVIDLSHNPKIEKEGWFQLIKTFFGSVLISIRSICLRSCSINNIKAQYLQDGLKEANLELRNSSDICLRCIEQIDLRDNPIPLSLQIDLQKNFLLSNILQSQMSQMQECKPEIIDKLQQIDFNRENIISQINKSKNFQEKPTASHICLGLESANSMDVILPNVLKQFSYIDNLVIHIDFQYLQKLNQGLEDLEQEYKLREEDYEEMQNSNQNEEQSFFVQKQKIQFRRVTLILNQTQTRADTSSFIELDQVKQKRSKFNKKTFKSKQKKKLRFNSKDMSSDEESNENNQEPQDVHNSPNQRNRFRFQEKQIKEGSSEGSENEDQESGEDQDEENHADLIFNYEKYKQKKKLIKSKDKEEDYYEFQENERNEKQIDPQIWESILTSLYNISHFEELIMQNCHLDGRSLEQICKLSNLKSIDLSNNKYIYLLPVNNSTNPTPKINPFEGFRQLFKLEKIQELNLSGTQINSRFVEKFIEVVLPKNQERLDRLLSLKTIDLSNNTQLKIKDWQNLIKTLINNTVLQKLIIKNCQIGKHNIQGLVNALLYAVNTSYLTSFDISGNTGIYPEDWGILIVNLFNRYKISNLNISYCAIYDQKIQFILKNLFINRMENLEIIDFSGNQIQSPENLFKFMNLLYQGPSIKEIKLENCYLNKKNTEYFNDQVHLLQIRTLKTQSSLQMVNFSRNPMILESYCHSYTYFQTFLENSTQYFQSIKEINLENCLVDQTKINSFIQSFVSINSKGLKVKSLITLNIAGNRITGEQFQEMLPLIAQVASSLQNLYIGNNYLKNQKQDHFNMTNHKQNNDQTNEKTVQQNIMKNSVQGITSALKKIQILHLQKIQISDEEEVSENDWQEFFENLFEKAGKTLSHIRVDGQRSMSLRESTFFSSLHKLLRSKKYQNNFMRQQNQAQNNDRKELNIQSIGYCQKTNPKINFVMTGFNWQSFVKNGFQPEVESGHILLLDNEEYEKHFWKVEPQQRSVYINLHNDMSIMKFEGTVQNDNFQQNLKLKADLYIALNYLRKFLNCEQKFNSQDNYNQNEIQPQLFLTFNYNYSKLPIFNIPDVLKAPFQFREVELTPVLKGYENLTFDYPLYIFFIQTCNLYPCDSIADFFVKLIKSLSNYYFSVDQGIFSMIQASPHFFLTEKDRDNIQKSMNKYKNSQDEDQQIAKQAQKKIQNILPIKQQPQNNYIQHLNPTINLPSLRKNMQSKAQSYLQNSLQINSHRSPELNHQESILQNMPSCNQTNILSKMNNNQFINQSSNQIQNEFQTQINKTQIANEISQVQLFINKVGSERQNLRQLSQVTGQNYNNQSFQQQFEPQQNNQKQISQKKQATKYHQSKLEQQKKVWTVLCPYYFSSDTMSGMEEIQIIHRIQKMPPSELELKGMSISAIKTIYAFCFQNPYFTACQMDYHHSVFVNTSLAWSLREKIYKGYCNSNRNSFKNKLQKMMFSTLRLMIRENVFYKYDNSAILLDQYYQSKSLTHHVLMILIVIYHLLTSMVPFLYSDSEGVTRNSHFIYIAFSFITFFGEYILIKDILAKILHLTPGIYISGVSTTLMQKCYQSIKLAIINQTFINYKYLIYLWYLICSQFSRFNTYSDFCFLVLCLKNNSFTIFYLSCLILFVNKVISIYRFIDIILKDEIKRKLPGYNITKFYEAAIQLEFIAYSEVLDIVSPYNVTRIPNNWLAKLFIPQISGQSMNQRIYYQLLKISFEDLPQIILQITYLIGQIDILAYISLIMSFISFSLAFYKVLSIRPSIISQLDFDELKIQKQSDHLMVLNEFEESESKVLEQIFKLNNNNEHYQNSAPTKQLILQKNLSSPLKIPPSVQNSYMN